MIIYNVVKGDNLWNIALIHGVTLNDLIMANPHITNPVLIYPGEQINIPINNGSHIIKKGDTMWGISKEEGIPLNNLINYNPQIKNPNLIYPNQIINIPTKDNEFITLESEVVKLVNNERRKKGLKDLSINHELTKIAKLKSDDFINNNYFAHNSPTYGSPFDMLKQFGVNYKSAGENIASGQTTANEAFNTWLGSEGHKQNMLNPSFNQTGVGIAKDKNGRLYWTQLFTEQV